MANLCSRFAASPRTTQPEGGICIRDIEQCIKTPEDCFEVDRHANGDRGIVRVRQDVAAVRAYIAVDANGRHGVASVLLP